MWPLQLHGCLSCPACCLLMCGTQEHGIVTARSALPATSLPAGLFNCPLAMTDGAARLCQLLLEGRAALHRPQQDQQGAGDGPARDGGQEALAAALQEAFAHLTSRDPAAFWTSGQVRGGRHPDQISGAFQTPYWQGDHPSSWGG